MLSKKHFFSLFLFSSFLELVKMAKMSQSGGTNVVSKSVFIFGSWSSLLLIYSNIKRNGSSL